MRNQLPKAILLDLDDTILAYVTLADEVWLAVCSRFAPRLQGQQPDQLLSAFPEHRQWYWSDPERHRRGRLNPDLSRLELVEGALNRLGIDAPSLAAAMSAAYLVQRDAAVRPFPGAVDALHRFKESGIRLALITNGNGVLQRRKVERFDLAPFFDCIVIEGEFGIGKPEERVYLHALQSLEAQPGEAWMVGDNLEWDVAAPQRLGLFGIWVDVAGTGLPDSTDVRPDRIIRSLAELP